MTLDESIQEKDIVAKINGLQVAIDGDLETYLAGGTIDYRKSWFGEGFQITGGSGTC